MIREIKTEDREQIIRLIRATKNFSDAEVAIAEELIDICTGQPEQKDYFAFVATSPQPLPLPRGGAGEGSSVAGFLLLGPTPATLGTYDMYWIAVDPEYQGQGIAQELDAYAVRFVKGRGGYLLIAETSSQPSYERTRAFYTKQHYEVLAQIRDYYQPGDDLVIFGKKV
jgi:ribosomal protein S18 acetylase RimI-like enzyme